MPDTMFCCSLTVTPQLASMHKTCNSSMVIEQRAQQPKVIIRRFQPEDAETVRKLIADGLWSVSPDVRREVWKSKTWYGRLIKAGSVGLPAIAVAALWSKPPAIRWPGLMASALVMPAVVYGYVFEVAYTYVKNSMKGDLADIPGTYETGDGSAFWVATWEGEVVGCVGLHQRTDTVAELRRMSVRSDLRGKGIGRLLCEELIRHARKQGFAEVSLVTSTPKYAALALYQKMGWTITQSYEPRMIKRHHLTLKL